MYDSGGYLGLSQGIHRKCRDIVLVKLRSSTSMYMFQTGVPMDGTGLAWIRVDRPRRNISGTALVAASSAGHLEAPSCS